MAPIWSELIVAVAAALVGWFSRYYLPTKKPADKPPARRNGPPHPR